MIISKARQCFSKKGFSDLLNRTSRLEDRFLSEKIAFNEGVNLKGVRLSEADRYFLDRHFDSNALHICSSLREAKSKHSNLTIVKTKVVAGDEFMTVYYPLVMAPFVELDGGELTDSEDS